MSIPSTGNAYADSLLQQIGQAASQYGSNVLATSVRSISIYTTWGPDAVVERPLEPSTDPEPNWLMNWLKPKVVIDTALGVQVYAPWGEPGPSRWPEVKAAATVAGFVLAGLVVLKLLR